MSSMTDSPRWIYVIALLGVLCVGIGESQAQWRLKGPFNRFSVEAQVGIDFPISPDVESGNLGSYISAPSVQVGVRYMFTDLIGVRPVLGLHRFGSTGDKPTLKIRRLGLEGVVNLAEFLPAGNFRKPRVFNMLLHAGGHYGREYALDMSSSQSSSRIALGTLGMAGQYRFFPNNYTLRNIVFVVDVTGHATVAQTFNYDGSNQASQKAWKKLIPNAYFVTGSIGVQIYLGRHAHHVDWK